MVATFRGIVEASYILNGVGAGPLIGIYLLAMFTTTANEPGTIIGFVVSFVFNAWIAVGANRSRLKKQTLPRSIAGCSATLNETDFAEHFYLQANNITLFSIEGHNTTSLLNGDKRYIFPLYRMSPVWLVTSGIVISVVVGYVASYVIDPYPNVMAMKLSRHRMISRRATEGAVRFLHVFEANMLE
ncbi:hypothetical protein AVEN_254645-1 [Araneus ventricosus]|uniref:Sodium-coupled monocarboxylate transporter 1 n=1 Tax=Araneus ventricosus TaxID=182803 RepID=A0A4Y2X3R2_ARAVE|nr:hypothetical protein AVEN_254645-1 [Araneus ventricosus]